VGRKEAGTGTVGDGSQSVRERVAMDVKDVGTGGMGLKYRPRADSHLAVESYTVVMLLIFILIIINIPSPLTPSFQA